MKKFKPCLSLLQHDPYPVYREYRRADPVHRGLPPMPGSDACWYLFRYRDVEASLKSGIFINERLRAGHTLPCSADLFEHEPLWRVLGKWMLINDPPVHTRLRSCISRRFTRLAVGALAPLIQQITDQVLDKHVRVGEMDLIRDLATPLPMAVIAKLLGIHISDPQQFRAWSRAIADALDMDTSPGSYDRAMSLMTDIVKQLRNEFEEKRTRPDESLMSSLLDYTDENSVIDEDELLSLCTLLMFAGQETTIDAIGNSVLALLQNPLQQKRLRDDPELIPNAIEELLRYNSPLQMSIIRVAAKDVKLGGKLIRRGDSITAVLGAANRDPEQFVNPDQLEITRNFAGRNVIFGQGIHNCPGAFLARLELQIVLATLLRRTRSIALTSDRLHWRDNIAFRGLTQLPVSFRAA